MKESKSISSVQNPLIKQILLLKEKSRERKKTGLFVVEGHREIELVQKGGYAIETLLHCPEISPEFLQSSLWKGTQGQSISLTRNVYEKIAHRGTTEGVMALVKAKKHELTALQFKKENPLILVAEGLEKPGNVGALLRTADAANVDAVLIANPKSDLYNPNIIRSSVGCVFTTPIGLGSTSAVIDYLKEHNITIYAAALTASKPYVEGDFRGATAIVVGTEATGLTAEWLQNSDQNLIIPMQGEIDSMNVSVSAAILIFEAKRQRGF